MEEIRKIYSVAELNRAARYTLENGIGEVWVEGEISRLTRQLSGHWYFTLKDEAAAVSCAMFKQNNATVVFEPKDGLKVRVFGQASLYEPRGSYQLIIRKMEEAGKGSLQEQFEKLKAKLAAEGLFDEARKKPLPLLPQKIGVVTSPTGAAIRDIINVLTRRFPNLGILLAPVTVQGEGAAEKIAAAIDYLNTYNDKVEQASRLPNLEISERDARSTLFFNPNLPLDIHERNLPHWQQDGTTYFVTFRLADSIPKEKLQQWQQEREAWLKNYQEPFSDTEKNEYHHLFSEKIQNWLDDGEGSCLLQHPDNAKIIADALKHFDGDRYALGEWVIMPNHVHALVTPNKNQSLNDILHSWKSFSTHEINKREERTGQLWQHESYDHIVRNPEQLRHFETYILTNPAKAGIKVGQASRLLTNERDARSTLPIDVMIVGRGGGSIEDLWAFNEEVVARAIAASRIPVISAVGHEIDFTISDFVADVRAPTPSAAAELAVPVKAEMETQIARLAARLGGSLQNQVHVLRERIPGFRQTMVHALRSGVQQRQQRVDQSAIALSHRLESAVAGRKQDLKRLGLQLRALSPLAVLDRGYSLTQTADGEVVRDAGRLKKGDTLRTRFAKGTVISEVKKKEA